MQKKHGETGCVNAPLDRNDSILKVNLYLKGKSMLHCSQLQKMKSNSFQNMKVMKYALVTSQKSGEVTNLVKW